MDILEKDLWEMKVKELLLEAEQFNASLLQVCAMDKDNRPVACVIAIVGTEECKEITEAVEAIRSRWHLRSSLDDGGTK